jgi:uncharacterized membrane protein YdjX (TVP38/TMEM64 family)
MRNRLILIALLAGIAAFAYFSGLYQYLAPDRLRDVLIEAGAWGPVVVVLLLSMLEPFGTPGAIFLVAAATIWPFWPALFINWAGATGAGMVGFAFARYFARDWVEGRMPDRLRKWDDRLSEKGLTAVILFRLFFFLNPASHWALGLSRVPTATAILGTAIGFLPGVVLFTYFGSKILDWFNAQTAATWVPLGLAILAIIAFQIYRRRRDRKSDDEPTSTEVQEGEPRTEVVTE